MEQACGPQCVGMTGKLNACEYLCIQAVVSLCISTLKQCLYSEWVGVCVDMSECVCASVPPSNILFQNNVKNI